MRRKNREEPQSHERWLVSYADFITLLFAFFTVLYATSQEDLEKQKQFQDSIQKAFKAYVQVGKGNEKVVSHVRDGSIIENPLQVFAKKNVGPAEIQDALGRFLGKGKLKAQVQHDAVGVRIRLASSSLFSSGSNKLKASAIAGIDYLAVALKATEQRMIVEGHTDSQPISNSKFNNNWDLASARAVTVVRYLIKKHQIDPSRLTVVAYADQKPLESNETEKGRAKNRRMEILLVTGSSEIK